MNMKVNERPPESAAKKIVDPEASVLDDVKKIISKVRDAPEDSLHKRLRTQLTPWAVGFGVLDLAVLCSGMKPLGGLIIGGLAIGSLTAGLWLPRALNMSLTSRMAGWARSNPRHTMFCASAAWVWFTAAIILGAGSAPALMTTGLTALFLLSARWWNAFRIGCPAKKTATSDVAEVVEKITEDSPVEETDKIARKWLKDVAASGKSLPGALLSDREKVPAGWSYKLHLVPGKQTLQDAIFALPKIATAINISQRNLLVEDVQPTEEDPEPDPAVLRFQVITDSPIKNPPPFCGPTWQRDGHDLWINLGPFADGVGNARWRVFSENSMWGGYVVGATGSGKSVVSDIIGISAMDTGLITVFYVDPKNGGSSPGLYKNADWAIGNDPVAWEKMLIGLETLIDIRTAENMVRLNTSGFTPAPRRPGVMVIVDECHSPFAFQTARWADIARKGRAVGVVLVGLSQIYGLDAFGNDDALRDSLTAGNTVALRVGRNQSSLIHGLPLNPSDLPNIPGYGIWAASDPTMLRSAPFRSYYAAEKARIAMYGHVARNMATLDALAIGALNNLTEDAYSHRLEDAETARTEMEQKLRDLEAGLKVSLPNAVAAEIDETLPELEKFLDDVEKFKSGTDVGLTGLKKVIYESVLDGIAETREIMDVARAMGYTSDSWVFDTLKELCGAGLIEQGKKGSYRIGAVA